jgi:hypothetical protein
LAPPASHTVVCLGEQTDKADEKLVRYASPQTEREGGSSGFSGCLVTVPCVGADSLRTCIRKVVSWADGGKKGDERPGPNDKVEESRLVRSNCATLAPDSTRLLVLVSNHFRAGWWSATLLFLLLSFNSWAPSVCLLFDQAEIRPTPVSNAVDPSRSVVASTIVIRP